MNNLGISSKTYAILFTVIAVGAWVEYALMPDTGSLIAAILLTLAGVAWAIRRMVTSR